MQNGPLQALNALHYSSRQRRALPGAFGIEYNVLSRGRLASANFCRSETCLPLYEYQCTTNKHRFEVRHGMNEEPVKVCPECGSEVRRVIHPVGIVFKGSGFYVNDSRKAASTTKPADSSEKKSDAGSSNGDKPGSSTESGTKSETKSESKSEAKSDSKANKAGESATK